MFNQLNRNFSMQFESFYLIRENRTTQLVFMIVVWVLFISQTPHFYNKELIIYIFQIKEY